MGVYDGHIPNRPSSTIGHTDPCADKETYKTGYDFEFGTQPAADLQEALFHEIGHAMDDMLGNYTTDPTPGSAFHGSGQAEAAQLTDLSNLTSEQFAQYANLSLSELVADLYMALQVKNLVDQNQWDSSKLNDPVENLTGERFNNWDGCAFNTQGNFLSLSF